MFVITTLLILSTAVKPSVENRTVVFQSGESGYFCVRIPAILTTATGSLLAFGEGRIFTCDDGTQKDIVYKRSIDNGKTWSNLKVLYRGNASGENFDFVGNFVPVQLKYNQRILVPFCKNTHILMQTYSDDDGLTFSQPEIIQNVTKPTWKRFGLGPPGSLLLQSNRILIPGDYSLNEGPFSFGFVMLNDFNGQIDKWYLGGEITLENYHINEAQAVELLPKTNSIFINSRTDKTVRIGSYSDDGGLTFKNISVLKTLVEPLGGCEGSTIYHQNSRQLFYTGLAVTSTVRTNLSLYTSQDEGQNWSFIKTIWPGPSAYSSLTTLNNQSVAVLFEGGTKTPYDSVLFTLLN